MNIFEAYLRTRSRVTSLVGEIAPEELTRIVPACPEWRARDLVAHVVALPAALGSGRLPGDDLQEWLDVLVAERANMPVGELLDEWQSLDAVLDALLNGPAGLLFDDLAVHEHDLRGALGKPDHSALEVEAVVPRALAALRDRLRQADLAPIAIWDGDRSWQSHEGAAGWTIFADAWEAVRVISSRRTEAEVRALPSSGDCTPYLQVLAAHLPLPASSLGER